MTSSDISQSVDRAIRPDMVIRRLIDMMSGPRIRSLGETIQNGDILSYRRSDGTEWTEPALGWVGLRMTHDFAAYHGVTVYAHDLI